VEALEENFPEPRAVYETEGMKIDKLQVLTNFLSFKIYEHIDECETYDEAVGVLDEVFASHLLATTKHQPGQTLDDYLEELRR